MALIKCPDCGKDVSSRAKNCPFCGCPIDELVSSGEINIEKKINNITIRTSKKALGLGVYYVIYCNDKELVKMKHGQTFECNIAVDSTLVAKPKGWNGISSDPIKIEGNKPYKIACSYYKGSLIRTKISLDIVDNFTDSSDF